MGKRRTLENWSPPSKEFMDAVVALYPELLKLAWFWDKDKGEDLAQSTVLNAYQTHHLFKPGNLKKWLFQIMRNYFLYQKRNSDRSISMDEEFFHQLSWPPSQPYVVELQEMLTKTSTLGEVDRELISLTMEGYEPRELENKFGLTNAAVKCRLKRVRARLKAWQNGV